MVKRILISQSGTQAIFKISKPTIDVTSASGIDNFLFDINGGVPSWGQPFASGTLTGFSYSATNVPAPVSITHNLGFIPVCLFFQSQNTPTIFNGGTANLLQYGGYWVFVTYQITTTNLIITTISSRATFYAGSYNYDNSGFASYIIINAPMG